MFLVVKKHFKSG